MRNHVRSASLAVALVATSTACTVARQITQDSGTAPMDGRVAIPDAFMGPDSNSGCMPGFLDCFGTCTRTSDDSMNCGSCGNACPAGTSCAVGRCDCLAPQIGCEGVCTDVRTDVAHCGTCANHCGSSEMCSMGECVVVCTTGQALCTETDAAGHSRQRCVEAQTDPMNCGTCHTTCAGGTNCVAGICTCPGSQTACGGRCVDTATDPTNCGTCISNCGPGGTCVAGVCATCGPGLTRCGTPARCVNTGTSTLHCGACGHACEAAQACNAGACSCMGSLVDCGSGCVDLQTNVAFCGACTANCGVGGACSAGTCSCAAGYTMCGTGCSNFMTDRFNCRTCGHACAATEACIAGTCVVAPLYHGWTSPVAGCSTSSYNATAATALGGTYPYNTGDSVICRAWKLAATVCTTMPVGYGYTPPGNFQCPMSGGFTDPVFGTYCAAPNQYSCSDCYGACYANCIYMPLSLRNCTGAETAQM